MNGEIAVVKERNFLSSLPAALWFLSIAIVAMRIAEVFYVPILPLYVKTLDAAAPLFLVGLVTGIHRLSLAFTQPIAGGWLDQAGRKRTFIKGAIMSYGVIMIAGSVVFLFGVPEPKRLKVV